MIHKDLGPLGQLCVVSEGCHLWKKYIADDLIAWVLGAMDDLGIGGHIPKKHHHGSQGIGHYGNKDVIPMRQLSLDIVGVNLDQTALIECGGFFRSYACARLVVVGLDLRGWVVYIFGHRLPHLSALVGIGLWGFLGVMPCGFAKSQGFFRVRCVDPDHARKYPVELWFF